VVLVDPEWVSIQLWWSECVVPPPTSNMNIGGVVFPLELQSSAEDDRAVYHGQYDTEGVPHTKSGDRQPVQVSIEVRPRLPQPCYVQSM